MPKPLPRAGIMILALLSACAPQGDFPSLAQRPIEREREDEEPPPPPELPSDPAVGTRATELIAAAREGNAQFESNFGAAAAVVTRAGAAGSESWIEAQQAVSRLETDRAATVSALAELDEMSVALVAMPHSRADAALLAEAVAEADAIARGQRERIERLQAALRSP